jgi:dihydrodipicolinate synthase/N-acetylneuraminate lyase
VLALAAVVPEPCVRLFELVRLERHDEARALQQALVPLGRLLGSSGPAGLKAAVRLVGIDAGVARPPLAPVSDGTLAALKDAIAKFQEVTA